MTEAQWLFEYYALKQREKEQLELYQHTRKMIVSMLGLDMFRPEGEDPDGPIYPLAMLCGNPEVLSKLQEESGHEAKALSAVEDPDFDAWSEQMAQGMFDTDLLPAEEADEPLINFSKSPKISFDED